MKYFSLFSGIGGFEVGINNSDVNLKCIGCSEIDQFAYSIYKRHFNDIKNYGDVREIDYDNLPNFDLLVGGFPCQSFSIGGNRCGFDDERGSLFFEIARILDVKRPTYFLLENVRNIMSVNDGNVFRTMLNVFHNLGYYVQWNVCNTSDYGIPQNRKRIFLKGFLKKTCVGDDALSTPSLDLTSFAKCDANTGNDIIDNNFSKVSERRFITTTRYGSCITITQRHRGSPFPKKQDNYVLEFDGESKPLIRKLTPLECERLQGFDDEWTKYGFDGELISDTQRYKCIGNAVTTNVVTQMIESFNLGKV